MLAQVRTPSGATYKGVLQLEATFIEVKNVSPPRLEPGSLEYRSNALTTKQRRHMMKNMLFTSVSQAMDILVYPIHLCQGVFILNLNAAYKL